MNKKIKILKEKEKINYLYFNHRKILQFRPRSSRGWCKKEKLGSYLLSET
jgi:hypothetical protein